MKTVSKAKKPKSKKAPARSKVKALPKRSQVKPQDCWDLESLYKSDADWEKAFEQWSEQIEGYERFKGKLAESAETLAGCLKFEAEFDRFGERVGTYAFLRTTEDQSNSDYQRMKGRYQHVATKAA